MAKKYAPKGIWWLAALLIVVAAGYLLQRGGFNQHIGVSVYNGGDAEWFVADEVLITNFNLMENLSGYQSTASLVLRPGDQVWLTGKNGGNQCMGGKLTLQGDRGSFIRNYQTEYQGGAQGGGRCISQAPIDVTSLFLSGNETGSVSQFKEIKATYLATSSLTNHVFGADADWRTNTFNKGSTHLRVVRCPTPPTPIPTPPPAAASSSNPIVNLFTSSSNKATPTPAATPRPTAAPAPASTPRITPPPTPTPRVVIAQSSLPTPTPRFAAIPAPTPGVISRTVSNVFSRPTPTPFVVATPSFESFFAEEVAPVGGPSEENVDNGSVQPSQEELAEVAATCGNNICDANERTLTCADCSLCGDNRCGVGENAGSCPQDCSGRFIATNITERDATQPSGNVPTTVQPDEPTAEPAQDLSWWQKVVTWVSDLFSFGD